MHNRSDLKAVVSRLKLHFTAKLMQHFAVGVRRMNNEAGIY